MTEKQKRRLLGLRFLRFLRALLRGRRLAGWRVREHRTAMAGTRHHDRKGDRGQHKDDRGVRGELAKKVCSTAGTKSGLRTLTAEGTGEIGRLTLLKQDDANEEEANNNVHDYEKNDHI